MHSLEAMRELLEEILDDALVVIAPAQDVIESGKTVGLAGLFLVVKLFRIELVVAHHSPVIASRIHWETRSRGSVFANDPWNSAPLGSSTESDCPS